MGERAQALGSGALAGVLDGEGTGVVHAARTARYAGGPDLSPGASSKPLPPIPRRTNGRGLDAGQG